MDTADLIRVKHTGEQWLVACTHGSIVYLNWPGNRTLRRDDVELVQAATATERHALLEALASSSGTSHSPTCARARLEALRGCCGDGDA